MDWPQIGPNYPDTLVREQPEVQGQNKAMGEKYRLVAIINDQTTDILVDSGSFVTLMSSATAQRLGLSVYKTEPIYACSATGPIRLDQQAKVKLDLGVVAVHVTFSIITDNRFSDSLILLGSNALADLNVSCDFGKEMIYIDNQFPVKMFTSKTTSEQHMENMKRDFVSLSSIFVKTNKHVLIPANDCVLIDVRMTRIQCIQLAGTHTFFTQNGIRLNGLECPDMVIDSEFPWHDTPIKIKMQNKTSSDRRVPAGWVIGALRPLVSKSLASMFEKSRCRPQEHDIQIIEAASDVYESEEQHLINTIFRDDPVGDNNTGYSEPHNSFEGPEFSWDDGTWGPQNGILIVEGNNPKRKRDDDNESGNTETIAKTTLEIETRNTRENGKEG